jgi:hypothetical protein
MYLKHPLERRDDHTKFVQEDLDAVWKIILKWILGKYFGKVWIGCIWLTIGTSGGPL